MKPNREFFTTVLYVSLVAALAATVTLVLSLKLWVMFIGWTCFGTGGGDTKRGVASLVCLLIGLLLGMASFVALGFVAPSMTMVALPVVVFVLAALAMMSLLVPPLDSVPGYFLGMTICYAANLPPDFSTFVHLASTALIGGAGAWLMFFRVGRRRS